MLHIVEFPTLIGWDHKNVGRYSYRIPPASLKSTSPKFHQETGYSKQNCIYLFHNVSTQLSMDIDHPALLLEDYYYYYYYSYIFRKL